MYALFYCTGNGNRFMLAISNNTTNVENSSKRKSRYFFIKNDNKQAFLEKNPLKILFLFCNTTQAADNNKVLSEEN